MSYPFVAAANDYGPRLGPALGFVVHMAEGGGTVGYLSRNPDRGVSVHYVVEYTGRIVQMLREDHASGSINPNDIRTTDDPDGFYGRSKADAVLGTWVHNPNAAVITVEVEGFAATGPNSAQHASLRVLVTDVRGRHPEIRLLGHRDFQDYKPCPGHLIHWADLGGHALEDEVRFVKVIDGKLLPVAEGDHWLYADGAAGGSFSAAAKIPVEGMIDSRTGQYLCRISTGRPYDDGRTRPTLVLVRSTRALVDAPTTPPPVVDCDDVVTAELDKAAVRASTAVRSRT